MNLTEAVIKRHLKTLKNIAVRLGRPYSQTISANDGDGLWLDVLPNGLKTWMFRYRTNRGTRRHVELGQYPTMSLGAARARRNEVAASC